MKKIVSTLKAPKAIGPYVQAIESNNMLFISGQLGLNPITTTLTNGIEEQTKQSLENLKAILEEAKLNFSNIVKTTIFITNMEDFPKINAIYEKYFNGNFPARSTIQVSALPKSGLIEIEAIATKEI